jgi:signal transduction histidine kinase
MFKIARSSAAALAAGYVALSIVALILFAAPLWYGWRETIDTGRAEILQDDSQLLINLFNRQGTDRLIAWINARINMQFMSERIILLTDNNKQPLAGNLPVWPPEVPAAAGSYNIRMQLAGREAHTFFVHTILPGNYHLLVGRDISRLVPLESRFWYGLAAAIFALLVVGALGALLIRRVLLLPVQGITQASAAIVAGDLTRRLPVPGATAELDALSRTINGLLDQIEKLVHGIRNVSNSIAHDLRTPLTELRSRLEELSLTRPSTEETFAEVDVDRVIGIFEALLRLAEMDTGLRRAGFVTVDLLELVSEAVDFYLPVAELRGISLTLGHCDAVTISGDPLLLAQAIGNLIDNALKFAPNQGHIIITAVQGGDGAIGISVADDGPGIPDHEKSKVTERFYRGDVSRGTPGTGLGLSLVEAVATLHGGRLILSDNHPGLCATMVLAA